MVINYNFLGVKINNSVYNSILPVALCPCWELRDYWFINPIELYIVTFTMYNTMGEFDTSTVNQKKLETEETKWDT